jgi:hypothetical protein
MCFSACKTATERDTSLLRRRSSGSCVLAIHHVVPLVPVQVVLKHAQVQVHRYRYKYPGSLLLSVFPGVREQRDTETERISQ